MTSAIYVGAAAQSALVRRLESLANNMSNMSTVGFRADGLKFDTVLSTTGDRSVAYPSAGKDYISTQTGPIVRTGAPLDLAVKGDGWFSLATPSGQVYTRDGRFQIAATGELQSVNGYPVLDASGAPMLLDPGAGDIDISHDGMIAQRGKQTGAVGLFEIDRSANLTRFDNSSVSSDVPATPILTFASNGIAQGFVEQSNVNAAHEMIRLIEVQRAFDNITAAMELQYTTQQDAIRALGSPS